MIIKRVFNCIADIIFLAIYIAYLLYATLRAHTFYWVFWTIHVLNIKFNFRQNDPLGKYYFSFHTNCINCSHDRDLQWILRKYATVTDTSIDIELRYLLWFYSGIIQIYNYGTKTCIWNSIIIDINNKCYNDGHISYGVVKLLRNNQKIDTEINYD